jgi:hypothetical protein
MICRFFELRPMAECVRESATERNLDGAADDTQRDLLSPVPHPFRANKRPISAKLGVVYLGGCPCRDYRSDARPLAGSLFSIPLTVRFVLVHSA